MGLFTYSLQRLLAMIPLIIGISILNFIIFALSPVDPVNNFMKLNQITFSNRAQIEEAWGLNQPIYKQYLNWAIPMFTKLDFGYSWQTGSSVLNELLPYVQNTVILFGIAFFITIIISTIMGIVAATNHNNVIDQTTLFSSLIGFSIPSFVLGLVIIIAVIAITDNKIVPIYDGTLGKNSLNYYYVVITAILTILINGTAFLTRLIRSQMLDILNQNYIRTARAKGLPERIVIYKHALRNALLPFITVIAISIPGIFGGGAVIEQVFQYPGIGRRLVRAALYFDVPVILASNMFFGVMTILMFLFAEIMYAIIDPRIKY